MFCFYSIFDHFYVIIKDLYAIVFHYYSITSIYIRLFIFDVLHLYSIVKAQQNLHNDMCALLGLMRVFAVGSTYRGGRDEGLGYDELGR